MNKIIEKKVWLKELKQQKTLEVIIQNSTFDNKIIYNGSESYNCVDLLALDAYLDDVLSLLRTDPIKNKEVILKYLIQKRLVNGIFCIKKEIQLLL